MNDSTRRYPRTLNEAFPWSKESAEWIEFHPCPKRENRVLGAVLCLFIGIGLASALVSWWSS